MRLHRIFRSRPFRLADDAAIEPVELSRREDLCRVSLDRRRVLRGSPLLRCGPALAAQDAPTACVAAIADQKRNVMMMRSLGRKGGRIFRPSMAPGSDCGHPFCGIDEKSVEWARKLDSRHPACRKSFAVGREAVVQGIDVPGDEQFLCLGKAEGTGTLTPFGLMEQQEKEEQWSDKKSIHLELSRRRR
ncbi:MAG: hypothetical protein AAF371_19385 [Pseudomonadota bacterium]